MMIRKMSLSTLCVGSPLSCHLICLTDYNHLQLSVPGTPSRSVPSSRPQSPGPRARGPLHASTLGETRKKSSGDPLKILPTDISQKIFNRLSLKELAKCAQVSRKWSKSQTLNYGASNRESQLCFLLIACSLVPTLSQGELP